MNLWPWALGRVGEANGTLSPGKMGLSLRQALRGSTQPGTLGCPTLRARGTRGTLPVPTARPARACPELLARLSYRSHARAPRSPLLASRADSCCLRQGSTTPVPHNQVPWFPGTLDSNSGAPGCLSAGCYSFGRGNAPSLVIHGDLLSEACTAPLRKRVDLDPVTWFPGYGTPLLSPPPPPETLTAALLCSQEETANPTPCCRP